MMPSKSNKAMIRPLTMRPAHSVHVETATASLFNRVAFCVVVSIVSFSQRFFRSEFFPQPPAHPASDKNRLRNFLTLDRDLGRMATRFSLFRGYVASGP